MKKEEKRVLDTFSDTRMTMNRKFKKQLRQRIVRGQRRRVFGVPRLVWIPAIASLAVVAIVVSGFQLSGGNKPFRPEPVQASELIMRSLGADGKFDSSKYTYSVFKTKMTYGDAMSRGCEGEVVVPSLYQNSESFMYFYQDLDNRVEAYYSGTPEFGRENYIQVYDTTDKNVIPDAYGRHSYNYQQQLKEILEDWTSNGQPNWFYTDKQGNIIDKNTIEPELRDGQWVYVVHARINPESVRPEPGVPVCGDNLLRRYVIDAENFQMLSLSSYEGDFSTDSWMFTYETETTYLNLSAEEAVRRMTEQGFDKEAALPEMPKKRQSLDEPL